MISSAKSKTCTVGVSLAEAIGVRVRVAFAVPTAGLTPTAKASACAEALPSGDSVQNPNN